jgi:hypothetical protein
MSLLLNFPHTADLYRVTTIQDDLGGDVESVADTAYESELACWVQPAGASEIREFAHRNQRVTHICYLTSNPGLKLKDKVDITAGPYSGSRLTIQGFQECTAGIGRAWKVMAEIEREFANAGI